MNIKNKMIAIFVIAIFIISVTGVNGALDNITNDNTNISNIVDENKTVNEVVELNETVEEVKTNEGNLTKTKNKLGASDDGSSIATIRLIDNYGNILINYEKKLVKGSSWTIKQDNVANRIGHIKSEDGGIVNPSKTGARYVKNGRTYSILGYNTEFPVKVTATGEDYTVDIILNVEPIDCQVTLTYVDNVTGETIRSTTNNILKGDSWIVEQAQFDNVVSNRMNITVDGRNYTFIDFNTSTPLTMEWQPNDYEVVVCLNYDEVIIPPEIDNDTDDNNQTEPDNETDDKPIIDNQTDNETDDNPVDDTNDTRINQTETNPIMDNNCTTNDSDNNTIPVEILKTGNQWGWLVFAILIIISILLIRRL